MAVHEEGLLGLAVAQTSVAGRNGFRYENGMLSCARLVCASAILALLAAPVPGAHASPTGPSPEATPNLSFKVDRLPHGTVVLHARGRIAQGDAARLEEAARGAGATEVWLGSPGGSAAEGMRIGRAIRSLGLATRVDELAICASACVNAFLGGVERYVARLGALGVHRPTFTGRPGWRERFEALIRKQSLDDAMRSVEGAILLYAYEYAAFLHEMGIGPEIGAAAYQTPHAEMRLPTQKEMREWRVTTGDWDPTGDRMRAMDERARQTDQRIRQMEEEERRRAPEELAEADRMQRQAEEMLRRSPDAETRRAAEVTLRLSATIRRRAEAALARPLSTD